MPVQIRRADLYNYVINALERDISQFRQALADHAKTEGVPAPLAVHTLVEAIARSEDGAFIVAEDIAEAERDKTPMATAKDLDPLLKRISDLEERAPPKGEFNKWYERVAMVEGEVTTFKGSLQAVNMNLQETVTGIREELRAAKVRSAE